MFLVLGLKLLFFHSHKSTGSINTLYWLATAMYMHNIIGKMALTQKQFIFMIFVQYQK